MRLSTAILATAPFFSWAFTPSTSKVGTIKSTSTSLEARRFMLPTFRRPSLLFPDFDRMFEEVDELMETSLATTRRPFGFLDGETKDLAFKRPLGFDVTQDDHEYRVAINVPDVDAKDLDLQLDHDGRVLRLKGERSHEEGGMKVQSRFEKAILLSPNVDSSKIQANMNSQDGTLTVVAPKIETKEALEEFDTKKIDIHVEEPKAVLESTDAGSTTTTPSTKLPVETLKHETTETKATTQACPAEQKWPVRDFPY